MPGALPWILAAVAAKMYGTYRQTNKNKEVKRGRNRAYADAQAKKKKLTEEALAKAKDTRSRFKKREVDDATAAQAEQLELDFSAMPRREFVAAPIRHGQPKVIANAQTQADAGALSRINRYAKDSAGLTALTGAFTSPEQRDVSMMNRDSILEKARQQRQITDMLGLKLSEFDPYSQEAQMANDLGDVLLMASMA